MKLKFDKTGKGKILVELTEEKEVSKMEGKIKGILDKGKIQNIRIYAENGKALYIEETTKTKIG